MSLRTLNCYQKGHKRIAFPAPLLFIYLWIAQLRGSLSLRPSRVTAYFVPFQTSKCCVRGAGREHLAETKRNSMRGVRALPLMFLTSNNVRGEEEFDMHCAWSTLGQQVG